MAMYSSSMSCPHYSILFNYVDSFSLFIIFVILIKREEFQKFKNQFDIFFSLGMHQHKMSLQGRSQLIVASLQ